MKVSQADWPVAGAVPHGAMTQKEEELPMWGNALKAGCDGSACWTDNRCVK